MEKVNEVILTLCNFVYNKGMKNSRVYVSVSPEMAKTIENLSSRLGVPKTQLTSLAIQAGVGTLIRSFFPEEAMTVDKIAEIVNAMQSMKEKKSEKSASTDNPTN